MPAKERGAFSSSGCGCSWCRCHASEHAEHREVRRIDGKERVDTRLLVCRGEKRVQKALSAQGELLQPGEKLPRRALVRKHMHNVGGRPPLLGKVAGRGHVKGVGETAWVGDDM